MRLGMAKFRNRCLRGQTLQMHETNASAHTRVGLQTLSINTRRYSANLDLLRAVPSIENTVRLLLRLEATPPSALLLVRMASSRPRPYGVRIEEQVWLLPRLTAEAFSGIISALTIRWRLG